MNRQGSVGELVSHLVSAILFTLIDAIENATETKDPDPNRHRPNTQFSVAGLLGSGRKHRSPFGREMLPPTQSLDNEVQDDFNP